MIQSTMQVYRITKKAYLGKLQATGYSGRWNSDGNEVIYCAESLALAFLENMIRRQGAGFNDDFGIMVIHIPDSLKISSVNLKELGNEWRSRDYTTCQKIGNRWYDECKTPILKVPSAVLPASFNYVINSRHPDYKQIKIANTLNLIPDERIEEILTNSKTNK